MRVVKDMRMILNALYYRIFRRNEYKISMRAKIGENVVLEGKNFIGAYVNLNNTEIGYGTYISDGGSFTGCKIGKFCSIGPETKRIAGTHPLDFASTHPAFYSPDHPCGLRFVQNQKFKEYRFVDKTYNVVIGNDVWIGTGVRIVDGVRIADGAVILAGAVVTKDIPSYAIAGGVPARVINYRFEESVIEQLQSAGLWNKPIEWIVENAELFEDVRKILDKLQK